MTVFRVETTWDYMTVSNWHLKTKNPSLKFKELLSTLFSLPNRGIFMPRNRASICKEGANAAFS